MDPLSALGLAGNVVAFVQFSAALIKGTYKIYKSPTGQSEELQDLESIYSKLADFSSRLGKSTVGDPENETAQAGALHQLADMCRSDCEQLLQIVGELKVNGNSRSKPWQSFTKAMAEVWRSNDIANLQKRVASCEQAMVVQMCATSRWVSPSALRAECAADGS